MRIETTGTSSVQTVEEKAGFCGSIAAFIQRIWDFFFSGCCPCSEVIDLRDRSLQPLTDAVPEVLSGLQQNVLEVVDTTRTNIELQYAANVETLVQQRDHLNAEREYLVGIKEKLTERISEAEVTKNKVANALHGAIQNDASSRKERLESLRNRMSNKSQPIG